MSEYYKAEDILAIFSEEERPLNWTDSESEIQAQNDFDYYKGMIESLPTIDIVTCVECMWENDCSRLVDNIEGTVSTSLWWCSDGVRSEE